MAAGDIKNIIGKDNGNFIINGDMRVSQRGDYTSFTPATAGVYYLDRWKSEALNVTFSIQDIGGGQPSALNASRSLYVQATSSSVGYIGFSQDVEDYTLFAGKTITMSAWVKSNNQNTRLREGYTDAQSAPHTGGGNWELLTLTIKNPESMTGFRWQCICYDVGIVSISSGDYIEFTGAKLEFGEVATPFVPRRYADELRLCRRYCYAFRKSSGECYGMGETTTTTQGWFSISFHEELRATPTYSAAGAVSIEKWGASYTMSSWFSNPRIDKELAVIDFGAPVGTANIPVRVYAAGEGYIIFDAEL